MVSAILQEILGIEADCTENPMYCVSRELGPSSGLVEADPPSVASFAFGAHVIKSMLSREDVDAAGVKF